MLRCLRKGPPASSPSQVGPSLVRCVTQPCSGWAETWGHEETAKQEHLASSFTSKYFRSTDWKTRVSVPPSNLPPKTADTTIPPLPALNASGHLPSSFPKVASIEQRPVNILCQSKWENRLACASKESSCNGGDPGSISGWGRSLEKGNATHFSILAWRIPWTVCSHGVAKSQTWLSYFDFTSLRAQNMFLCPLRKSPRPSPPDYPPVPGHILRNVSYLLGFPSTSPSPFLVLVTQSYPTLCDSMDCSPSGSPVHGILQARILEWVAIPFSRGSSWPRD